MAALYAESLESRVEFYPFCADCGHAAEICHGCQVNPVYAEDYRTKNSLCSRCWVNTVVSDTLVLRQKADRFPFKCKTCRLKTPWAYTQ
jgi:hypothetical protein